ncbi:SoxR-reducing system protein RseC [Proteus myxofaciens]|uniref:Sigma factor RpoE regulatory protein n=1 Tax=Proteus myxofaciens ATCC 19692 TaxID=1354337 RepID=A0A198GE61_9GAMM|nr:SoxR-reducing system protein RseC [Proteus myxofaciens]OAT35205.1 sigma factor RpoE regulatory protein [Proteus myxofaciens ATCC 19692]
MVKEWATVVHWHKGRVLLRYGSSAGCGSCQARAACGSYLLNKIGPETVHQLELSVKQPLVTGQKVEVGIPENNLLLSAMLVYLTPLIGLFIVAGIASFWLSNEFSIFCSGAIGGIVGFLLARKVATWWSKDKNFEPVILQIGLPPNELNVHFQE